MVKDRWFDPDLANALTVGAVWDRRKGRHEPGVTILKAVTGRAGDRFLVQGLTSGRQWLVSASTLLATYQPRPKVKAVKAVAS